MLDLLLFPFELAWELLTLVWNLVTGLISLVFGLLGGALSLATGILTLATVAALITLSIKRREEYKRRKARDEDFISYYDKDAVK